MPRPALKSWLGTGMVGGYALRPDGTLEYEGPRPGPGWHRHDWQRRALRIVTAQGVFTQQVVRRRWRLGKTPATQLDHVPDELGGIQSSLPFVLLKLWAWLRSGVGVHVYEEAMDALEGHGCRRTVQRWLGRIQGAGMRLQQAIRTAVIERLEPQPVEMLFPSGLSPPGAIRRRRWKDLSSVYSLATALAFLFEGAVALQIAIPALLAEALGRLDGPILTAAPESPQR